MGSEFFEVRVRGKSAKDAFDDAVQTARYEYGHGGGTGTIAEKEDFVMIDVPPGVSPDEFPNIFTNKKLLKALFEDEDGDCFSITEKYDKLLELFPQVDDKWGPAGCIDLGKGNYIFFGWACC